MDSSWHFGKSSTKSRARFDVDEGSANAGTFFQTWTGTGPTAAEVVANSLLAGLGGPITQNYELTFLQSIADENDTRSQNLVTVTAVPLPAAAFLLAAGIAGLGMVRRRG